MNRQFSGMRSIPLILISAILFFSCDTPEPNLNERYPVKEPNQLSPPIVSREIHECAEAVHVWSFIPHATVTVFANGTEVVGEDNPHFGYADIVLKRALKLGESITATQKVGTATSVQSIQPVVVSAYPPGGLTKPKVGPDLFECGIIVPTGNLTQSVKVHVFEDGTEIGSGAAATDWLPIATSALHNGKQVTAVQSACETVTGKTITSPPSDPVTVKPAPNPVPTPTCDPSTLYVGNDAVALGGLFVGANVTVKDNGVVIGGGYATDAGNWVPLTTPITSASRISAVQELCGVSSTPSKPVAPAGELLAPVILEPICAGSRFAVIRKTTINSSVVLLLNGSVAGYAGAINGDLIISLGGTNKFSAGDHVQAVQYIGSNISPVSNTVTVVKKLESPAVEIVDDEPFFHAESGEQAIEGPVFPRGRGNGPRFLIQACCEKKVRLEVRGPDGKLISQPDASEIFPGYYAATWDWHSMSNWVVPSGIPVGEYTVTVHSDCASQEVTRKFYVIFNPADVGGPVRFSYDETGVWFGTLPNATRAVLYYLHPDDKRVFDKAIKAASGQTDPRTAAGLVAQVEEALFSYSLNYNSNDVVDMIENHSEAQCADDANCLTSMLRSVGIPSHPATADADLESGNAGWTFDTWTELLVPGTTQPEWQIIHPHQFPGMNPESRSVFGSTRGVALKSFNDLVVMAGENWDWTEAGDGSADVNFTRPTCSEPDQNITKKVWINELCEQGYWSPNHWDCSGLGTSSSGLGVSSIQLDMGDAGFGRTISGRVTYLNRTNHRLDAGPIVQLVGDLVESKKFPDTIYENTGNRVSLAAGDSATLPFRLKLPSTIRPGLNLMINVNDGKRNLGISAFSLSNSIKAELIIPDSLSTGTEFRIVGKISNTSKQVVTGVVTSLTLPFAIELRKAEIPQQVSLQPGESRSFTWPARVLSPLEAGTAKLDIATANGGSVEVLLPVRTVNERKIIRESTPGKNKK